MAQISQGRARGTHKTHALHPTDPGRSACGYWVARSKNLFHIADPGETVTCKQCAGGKVAPSALESHPELFNDRRSI